MRAASYVCTLNKRQDGSRDCRQEAKDAGRLCESRAIVQAFQLLDALLLGHLELRHDIA